MVLAIAELNSGKMTAEGWEEYCEKRAMREWALVAVEAPEASI